MQDTRVEGTGFFNSETSFQQPMEVDRERDILHELSLDPEKVAQTLERLRSQNRGPR